MSSSKKMISILLGVMITVSLFTGCGKKDETDRLTDIKRSGKILVATEGTWTPWTYKDEEGNFTGFDIELTEAIAEKLGAKIVYFSGNFDTLMDGVISGRYDIMVNGVTVTDERKEKMNFTRPYAYMKTVLVVAEDNKDISSLEDLKGKTVANSYGTSYGDMAEAYGAEIKSMQTVESRMEAIISGTVDGSLNSEYSIYDYLKSNPDAPIKIAAVSDEIEEIAIPVTKNEDSETLRLEINRILDELESDGTISKLSEKYFGTDISKPE